MSKSRNKLKAHLDRLALDMQAMMNKSLAQRMCPGKPDPKYANVASGSEAVRNWKTISSEIDAVHATDPLSVQAQRLRDGLATLVAMRRLLDTDPNPDPWLREFIG